MKSTYYAFITDSNNVSVPNSDGCTNLTCMDIVGNNLYCIKVNTDKTKACLYQYSGSGTTWTSKSVKSLTAPVLGATGMSYYEAATSSGSLDKALFVACNNSAADGVKFVKMKLDGILVRVFKTVTGTDYAGRFGAITKYKGKEFIVLANGLSTADKLCLMRGQFNKETESFDTKETFYVKNRGYQSTQDIYYNENFGLFILSCEKDDSMCKNLILQVDYDGLFQDKSGDGGIYEPIDRIGVLKNRTSYNKYMVSSMSIDSAQNIVTVGNIEKTSGTTADAIQCFVNMKLQ